MVFESILSDVLNQVLGNYVENLNAKQFNVSLWQGNVVLEKLRLKQNAVDELELPFKLKYGLINQVILKIPWTNLYNAPVEAHVDGIYVLLVPHVDIKYNAEQEFRQEMRAKMAELSKVEGARKAAKKCIENKNEALPSGDTFAEKMATLIIKNLQVSVKDVHIRYEDEYTDRKRPFAFGLTLNGLYFQSADENWKSTFVKDTPKFIHKLIDLNNLCFYWNSYAKFIGNEGSSDKLEGILKKMIPTSNNCPTSLVYVLAPISICVKVQLNSKPESDDFSIPKVLLTMSISELLLDVGKYQYEDMMNFVEAQNRLNLNAKYRKFRPNAKSYKKNYKLWWRFAYQCVLENIHLRRKLWSWAHMKEYRQFFKSYKAAWIESLTNKNPPKTCQETIEIGEKNLDVFNLNIARELAELEMEKCELKRVKIDNGWGAWFSSWFGGDRTSAENKDTKKKECLRDQWSKALTKEERKKLYTVIDYVENQSNIQEYPLKFISVKIDCILKNLSVIVLDDLSPGNRVELIVFKMNVVSASIIQQPASRGLQVTAKLPNVVVTGKSDKARYGPNVSAQDMKLDVRLNLTNLIGTTVDFVFTEIKMTVMMSVDRFMMFLGLKSSGPPPENKKIQMARRKSRKNLWQVKKLKDLKLWYLKGGKKAVAQVVAEEIPSSDPYPAYSVDEEVYIDLSAFSFTIETVAAPNSPPRSLFTIVLGMSAVIQNWSTELEFEGGMSMEIAYYNEKLKVWEPVLEPVEMSNQYKPWEISLNIKTQREVKVTGGEYAPPRMAIAIVSTDVLQLTITRTCLDMFNDYYADLFIQSKTDILRPHIVKAVAGIYKVTFHNTLPYDINVSMPGSEPQTLKGGDWIGLENCIPGKSTINVQIILKQTWMCTIKVEKNPDELEAHLFTTRRPDGSVAEMDLGIRATKGKLLDLSLYCPFWMVNKTSLPLMYKSSTLNYGWCCSTLSKSSADDPAFHAADSAEPLMFTFNGKSFFKKKKICLKIGDAEWSKKFPVDIVGSAGRIICKHHEGMYYEVSLTIQINHSGLTKICTFTPFYVIDNNCTSDIEVRESGSNDWHLVPTNSVVPFWPKQSKGLHRNIHVRYFGKKHESLPFSFTESFEAFVPIKSEDVGVDVRCHVSENSVVVDVEDYQDGMAPAFIVNATETFEVTYGQHEVNIWKKLSPGTCVYFNWERLSGKRALVWSCGNSKLVKNELFKDGSGEYSSTDNKELKGFWVSFLDSRQRVLLFTEDPDMALLASQTYLFERIDQQITFSFNGIGMSLVDNMNSTEIAYISITSSDLVWEYKKKQFKAMTVKDSIEMENAFTIYMNQKLSGTKDVKPRQIIGNVEADFELMKQYKPVEREIRRSFQAGFWLQYKLSAHEQHLHFKINHMQIDNQLPNVVFPIAFAPAPLPQSVLSDHVIKPFVEVSFVSRKAEHSTVPQVKYFKILVQEMILRIDRFFINSLFTFYYGGEHEYNVYTPDLFRKDMELTQHDLAWYASIVSSKEQKSYYEHLHFSPIKVHFSYSQGGWSPETPMKHTQLRGDLFNLFIKSFGVTLTEIQDVVFKLAYFEREAVFLNRPQLLAEVTGHYTKQGVKQAYVLIFGLDIIGNPFGLVRDLSTGVETFFYEPFQGAILGPEEFAEGLVLGVKSLVGSAVGGAAGAVSRITGTVGKGVAALTFDEDYQKKRQQMLYQRSASAHEGFFEGGKGLVMGFYSGLTGVFTQPIKGAKKEGVPGFFKGMGKGAIGLVVRPVSGIVDFTSASFESVKRMTGVGTEPKKIRAPRFIRSDKVIGVFSSMEANGNQMLQEISKGKYARTDSFIIYIPLTPDDMFYLIITNKRVIMAEKSDLFGSYDIGWSLPWQELDGPPTLDGNSVDFKLKKPAKTALGFFGRKASGGKKVHVANQKIGKWIVDSCKEPFRLAKK